MSLHLIRATALAAELAKDQVSSKDQASYLAASFILWLVPAYFLIIPAPDWLAWPIPMGLWFYEAFALSIVYYFGVLHCLAKCSVEPKRNFMIDFSCLYTPISVTTLILVWGTFHLYASLIPWLLKYSSFDGRPYFLEFIYSRRFFDLVRFSGVVAATFIVLVRTGNQMQRVSSMRLSANIGSSGRE